LTPGVERGGGDDHGRGDALAGAGFATDEHVALDQREVDRLAVLIDPDRDLGPQVQPRGAQARPRIAQYGREGVAGDDHDVGVAGVGGVAGDAHVHRAEVGGDRFGGVLEVGHGASGGDAHAHQVAGGHGAAAGDHRDAVVAGGELGVPAGAVPGAAQVGSVQQPGQPVADRPDRHQGRGGEQQQRPRRPGRQAQADGEQPPADTGQAGEREFGAVGPGGAEHEEDEPVGGGVADLGFGDDRVASTSPPTLALRAGIQAPLRGRRGSKPGRGGPGVQMSAATGLSSCGSGEQAGLPAARLGRALVGQVIQG
jgi:hypothetical protein